MSDILDSIRESILEILGVFLLIDALQGLAFVVSLNNAFYAGQITAYEYAFRLIFQFFFLPAITSILVGIIIHKILDR